MLQRELAIAFRARATWIAATLAALLVGHGFVLAIDLFSNASRSALANALMRREMDPLAGIVRPTLGGAQLATAILVPVMTARLLAVEKERNTFGAMALALGSPARLVGSKLAVAPAVALLTLVPPVTLFALYGLLAGHLDAVEVAIAITGHALHAVLVATLSVAAASVTRTVAQATTVGVAVSLLTWALEAGEGFAALAWLGPLEEVSLSQRLVPFDTGVVHLGALSWFVVAIGAAVLAACLGARFDLGRRSRAALALGLLGMTAAGLIAATRVHRGYDWSELRRASLPPAAVSALRTLDAPIEMVVVMNREDSRRRQLERDVLAKLQLARADLRVSMPLDRRATAAEAPDEAYGTIEVHVSGASRTTRSTSRREITTLIFEAAGQPIPDWSQVPYPGYPAVVDGWRRVVLALTAYFVLPGAMLLAGFMLTRGRRAFRTDSRPPFPSFEAVGGRGRRSR